MRKRDFFDLNKHLFNIYVRFKLYKMNGEKIIYIYMDSLKMAEK